MLPIKNVVSVAMGSFFLLSVSTTVVLAADAAKESAHQHQSGQGSSHGDGKSDDRHSHHGHQCGHMMSSVDQNKDGKISKEEFMKHHEAMFDKKDANKDGVLDTTEMHCMMMDHMHKQDHQKEGEHSHGDTKK